MDDTITIEVSKDGFYISGENTSGVMYYCSDANPAVRKIKLTESVWDYVNKHWGKADHV